MANRPAAAGSRVCVENSSSLDPTGKPLAVEAWVKARKPDGVIIARGGARLGYALFLEDGKPCFAVRNDGRLAAARAEKKALDGWVHVAGVLTGDKKLQVFVDGKLAATAEAPGLIAADPNNAMEIGEDASSAVADYKGPFPFTGTIDEIRVYHGQVTADEIARHCAAADRQRDRDARLVLLLSFDNGEAKDRSGRGNHGRIEGAKPVEGKIGGALAFAASPGGASPKPAAKPRAKRAPKKLPRRQASGFHVVHDWSRDLPLMVRAMVLAGDTLLVAGPQDIVDEEDAAARLGTPEIQAKLAEQDAALRGQRGGLLWTVSTGDGAKLAELRLASPPVWDGMAVAGGRVYTTMTDGTVRCFGGR
jgi:hypothetical protein